VLFGAERVVSSRQPECAARHAAGSLTAAQVAIWRWVLVLAIVTVGGECVVQVNPNPKP